MKKIFFLSVILFTATICVAQNSGLGFTYQAVIRRSDGILLANENVTLRVSLYPGQHAATPTWVETHKVQTDYYGTFAITIGKGTRESNSKEASFKDINFAAVFYWMTIEIEENGKYREVSNAQLPSVPYSEVTQDALMFSGLIAPFAGPENKIPGGWLLCDGRTVSRSDYPDLFNAIGISWGKGDGSKTFNLPDLRGMFLRGVSGESGNDQDADSRKRLKENGGNEGNNVGSYQEDAIRNITGQISGIGEHLSLFTTNGAFYAEGSQYKGNNNNDNDNAQIFFDASRAPGVSVGSDNRPKNVYVNYIIKY